MRGDPAEVNPFIGYRYHAFVSYCSKDLELVGELVHTLQDEGLRIWWDRDTGEHDKNRDWRAPDDERGRPLGVDQEQIRRVLESVLSTSTLVIVVATKIARRSSWVQIEFAHAFDQRQPIVIWHADGDFGLEASQVPSIHLRPDQLRAFAGELKTNSVIAHISNDRRSLPAVAQLICYFISFAEFLEWRNDGLDSTAFERHRTYFDRVWNDIPEMLDRIEEEHGRRLRMSRTPYGEVMPNRRITGAKPWIIRTHEHLTKILLEDDYRKEVFEAIDKKDQHKDRAYRGIARDSRGRRG